ncbi:MAG: HPr family phosphocarrier protein [Victivallales bacterium]|nr:HPr family phosphocarrier protein [Victivallales bacterium]
MSSSIYQDDVVVRNKHGLHLRVAAELTKLCRAYQAHVALCRADGQQANVASPLSMLTLAATPGTVLRVRAEGIDAQAALSAVVNYFASEEAHAKS